jgi:hypothetical protein
MVETLLGAAEAAAGRPFDASFRERARRELMDLSAGELAERQQRVGTLGLAVPSTPGDANRDLVYTPVPPCRIVDTRLAGGSLAAGTQRDMRVTGVGLQFQGGAVAGCGVPVGPATAAVLNFVAVNPTGPGNLRAWAYSTPPVPAPTASILNYTAGQNIANGIVVPLCDVTATTCPFDLRVQADTNNTHLVVDVVGYFHRLAVGQVVFVQEVTSPPLVNLAPTCTTLAQVTVNAPTAGKVVLTGIANFYILHNQGTVDSIFADVTPNAGDCGLPGGSGHYMRYLHAGALDGYYVETGSLTRVHNVPGPGTYTFYFTASASVSPAVESAQNSRLTALFLPN